jgi:hypothetical protein
MGKTAPNPTGIVQQVLSGFIYSENNALFGKSGAKMVYDGHQRRP